MNKRYRVALLSILGVILIVFLLLTCRLSKVDINKSSVVSLKYVHDKEYIDLQLTDSESELILSFFSDKKLYWDSGISCYFNDEIYLSVGEGKAKAKFYPACDGCDTIKYRGKIFHLTSKEGKQLHSILNKYNAKFPCI